MKPVSVIFLIVSGIMIIVGLLVCSFAMVQANNQNIDLYDMTIEDGQSKAEYDFSEDIFNRIQISVGKCTVRVVCGADENKVVMRNFSSAGYVCEVENRTLVIEDTVNIADFTELAKGNFRFKGFRYYLRDRKITSSDKSVTVYVTDKFDVKALDITVEKGDVSVIGYENGTDYNIDIKTGNLTAKSINTDSTVKAKIGKGSVDLTEVTSKIISIEVEEGNIKAAVSGREITALAQKGDIYIDSMDDLAQFNFTLRAPKSQVTLVNRTKDAMYVATDAQLTNFIHATSETGKVVVGIYEPTNEIDQIGTDLDETGEPGTDTEPATDAVQTSGL